MSKWRSGPPPSIGWWPASVCCNPISLRWWNGEVWSCAAFQSDTPLKAEWMAFHPAECANIQWMERPKSWPARSLT